MTDTSTAEVPTASLVGAISVFPLNDVLGLLSDTGQRGELQVVGKGVDGHLWIEGKDFVGATLDGTKTVAQAVFEFLLLDDGWFYFTSGQTAPVGQGQRQSVLSVINEVVPQVQEWRELLKRVPLEAQISMSRSTPGPEVQIRADQWRVLTAVGTSGRTVSSVVEELEEDSVVTIRLLRELVDSGLLTLTRPGERSGAPSTGNGLVTDQAGAVPPPPPGFVTSAPVTTMQSAPVDVSPITDIATSILPPAVTTDPWAPPGSRDSSFDASARPF